VVLGASRLVVGSEQGSYAYSGTVHVYQREGGVWKLEQIVSHKETFTNPSFGSDVALADDERTLFVGAPSDVAPNHGAVHIFRRDDTLGWTAAGKLVAPDGEVLDWFGGTLDVSGGHLAVAAYRTNDMAFDSGSIYMFARQTDGTWSQTQKLTLADGAPSHLFGDSLAIKGTLSVASTATRDVDGFADQGLVHTYQRDSASGQWRPLEPLIAHDGSPTDYFGSALALAGNRLAVGAYGRGVPKSGGIAHDQGSVYIYERDHGQPSGWRFLNLIKSDDGAAGDWFGRSIAFNGETMIVGAPRKKNTGGVETGAAYAFVQNGGGIADNWRQVHKFIYSGNKEAPWFGDDVVISNSDIFIGARRDSQIASDQGSGSPFQLGFHPAGPGPKHQNRAQKPVVTVRGPPASCPPRPLRRVIRLCQTHSVPAHRRDFPLSFWFGPWPDRRIRLATRWPIWHRATSSGTGADARMPSPPPTVRNKRSRSRITAQTAAGSSSNCPTNCPSPTFATFADGSGFLLD